MKAIQSFRSSSYGQTRHITTNVMAAMTNLVRRTLGGKKTTIGSARVLFFNCKDQSDNAKWYTDGLVSTEFRSKHTMLMTHVWMVHKRLLQEGPEGLRTQECMFDELWEDTCARLRALGINELSINKYLGEVQSYSFKYCVELDEALSKESEEEVVNDMGGAIWRNAYVGRDDMDENHVLKFASYLRKEQQSLMTLPIEAFLDGRIKWGPIPKFDRIAAGSNDEKNAAKESSEEGEWKEAISVGGKIYYWNTATRESTWDKPSSLA